jgi:hypothetical protein
MVRHLSLPSVSNDPKEYEESVAIVAHGLKNPPTTSKALYIWLRALTGDGIPFKPVCSGHATPWDMVWESYRIDLKDNKDAKKVLIAVGPRDGQKTRSMAKLMVAELLLKQNCESACVAATDLQASRSSNYMKRFLAHPMVSHMVTQALSRNIGTRIRSRFEQLVGGRNAINSIHCQKLRTDETELVRPVELLDDMKMIPSSYNGLSTHQIYCSTRKFVKGNMTNLIMNSKPSYTKVLIWCYKEITERCSDDRSGTKPSIYEVPDISKAGESVVVSAYDRCGECPLLPSCRGDLKRASGFVSIDDVIDSYHKLSREAWLVQKECIEPSRSDLFFADWDTDKQVGQYPYNPKLPLDLSFDFSGGAEDPTSAGFWQFDGQNQYRIHEMIFRRKPSTFVAAEVETWCKDRAIRPRFMIGDSTNQQFMLDLRSINPFFKGLRGTKKIGRREGWQACKRFVKDTMGVRHLFVNESCHNFISEIENAHSANDPDDLRGEDHSLDDWRYWTVEFHSGSNEPRIRWFDPEAMAAAEKKARQIDEVIADSPKRESDISEQIARETKDD